MKSNKGFAHSKQSYTAFLLGKRIDLRRKINGSDESTNYQNYREELRSLMNAAILDLILIVKVSQNTISSVR